MQFIKEDAKTLVAYEGLQFNDKPFANLIASLPQPLDIFCGSNLYDCDVLPTLKLNRHALLVFLQPSSFFDFSWANEDLLMIEKIQSKKIKISQTLLSQSFQFIHLALKNQKSVVRKQHSFDF